MIDLHRTAEERSIGRGRKLPDAEYNRAWISRVKLKTVIDANGCWVWQGWIMTKGYGGTTYRGENVALHRQAYQLFKGVKLVTEQFVCHSCDNKPCWNPDHLWLGNNSENQRDAGIKGLHQESKKTHCPCGHAYDSENTYYRKLRGGRVARSCKACEAIRFKTPAYAKWRRKYQQRRRAKLAEARTIHDRGALIGGAVISVPAPAVVASTVAQNLVSIRRAWRDCNHSPRRLFRA